MGALVSWSLSSTQLPHDSTDCTLSQAMAQEIQTIEGEASGKEAAESTIQETPSSFEHNAPADKDVVDFDPKQCPWDAIRDVVYAKQNTKMNQLDICKALKVLYPDKMQFQNMSSLDAEKMAQWWSDPSYPYRHRPLFCGPKGYEYLGLRLKQTLSPPKTARPLAAAPVAPMLTASPRKESAQIPLPPRHPPRDSIFTTEGSPRPEKTKTRRSVHREAAKQSAVPRKREVKMRDNSKNEVTRQQSLTRSTNAKGFKIPSNLRPAKPLFQDNKASTHCHESSSNSANDYGDPTHSHAEDKTMSELGSLPYPLPVEGSSNVPILQSQAQFQQKPMKKSLVLAPPPQLMSFPPSPPVPGIPTDKKSLGICSVKHPELPANSIPKATRESGHNPSPTYWNYSTPPNSPSRPFSNPHPAKRRALGEKPSNVWQHNGAGYRQLPSISSLFPLEHWSGGKNPSLNPSTAGLCRTAGQEKNQITTTRHGANPPDFYGLQDRPFLLPPLELSTPSIPSLSPSSVVTPTSSTAEGSTMTYLSTPSSTPLTHSDFGVRKRYSEGTLKYSPVNHSDFVVRKRYSESTSKVPPVTHSNSAMLKRSSSGTPKFSPSTTPYLAIRDVALASDKLHLPKSQIALILRHRYGDAYPSLKQVTTDQVQELWEASRTCRGGVYKEEDCGGVELQLRNDARMIGAGV